MKIVLEVKTSYAKIGKKYEVVSVVETELQLGDSEDIPENKWINEYHEIEYFPKN